MSRFSRLAAAALPALVLVLLTGCDAPGGGSDQQDALDDLASALESRDLSGVALTVDATAAQKQLDDVLADLDDLEADVEAEGDGVHWSWEVAGETWAYDAPVDLVRDGDEWQVAWAPSIIEPSLEDGEVLDRTTVAARRGDIIGAHGDKLVTLRPVIRFGIDKVHVRPGQAEESAVRLADLLDIDPVDFRKRVHAAGPKAFVEGLVLRENDAARIPSYQDIPGAAGFADRIPLAPTREFAAPLLGTVGQVTAEIIKKSHGAYEVGDEAGLSGLQARYDDQLRGSDGMQVRAVAETGESRVLFTVKATPGEPLRLTLDRSLQEKAESALVGVGPASALVAIRPSTGDILAAASGPGSNGYNTATYGQYEPGSTFKQVSSLALLRAGLQPDSAVHCVPRVVVDGKPFENYDDYPPAYLGDIPLRTAVAQSCNTAFIGEHDRLHGDDLAQAAAALGFGVDHDLGFPAYFGQVPEPASETEGAADLIGQGKILASPMAMATVIASVQAGHAVLPRLLPDYDVDQVEPQQPLTRTEAAQLRAMLRGVVLSGSGRGLLDVPGAPVIAKTGTAEYVDADGRLLTHAWMVAAQGDLAVAVFVEQGESGSGTAGPLLEEFLRRA